MRRLIQSLVKKPKVCIGLLNFTTRDESLVRQKFQILGRENGETFNLCRILSAYNEELEPWLCFIDWIPINLFLVGDKLVVGLLNCSALCQLQSSTVCLKFCSVFFFCPKVGKLFFVCSHPAPPQPGSNG